MTEEELVQIAGELSGDERLAQICCEFIDKKLEQCERLGIAGTMLSLYRARIEGDKHNMLYNADLATGEWGTEVDAGWTEEIRGIFDAWGYSDMDDEDICCVLWVLLRDYVLPSWYSYMTVTEKDQKSPYVRTVYMLLDW